WSSLVLTSRRFRCARWPMSTSPIASSLPMPAVDSRRKLGRAASRPRCPNHPDGVHQCATAPETALAENAWVHRPPLRRHLPPPVLSASRLRPRLLLRRLLRRLPASL